MRLSNVSITSLVGGRPKLETGEPTLRDGKWLMSGKMIVEFQGLPPPGAIIVTFDLNDGSGPQEIAPNGPGWGVKVPFSEAADEDDAVKQAATHLQKMAADLKNVADVLLQTPAKK